MQQRPSPATGRSDHCSWSHPVGNASVCAGRTELSGNGNSAALVAKCALAMVRATIGVNADAGRPFASNNATFSDTAVVQHGVWQWARYQGFFVR